MIKVGDFVRDVITGFEGRATARAEYMFASPRIQVTTLVDDKIVEAWIDEERLVKRAPTKEEVT